MMKPVAKVMTFTHDYIIAFDKDLSVYFVQFGSDEALFFTKEDAVNAIYKHSFDCLFEDRPCYEYPIDNDQLQEIMDFLNESDNRRKLFKFVAENIPEDMRRICYATTNDVYAMECVLNSGYYENFDNWDSSVCHLFISTYRSLEELYMQIIKEK